jgi:hypothetical protein
MSRPPSLDSPPLSAPQTPLSLAGAVVLGVLLASLSVFAAFLLFNVILHWGS